MQPDLRQANPGPRAPEALTDAADALSWLKAGRPPRSPGRASGDGGQGPRVRQSSDSTLHPQPSGRPSSAPSGRSSFDSCADEGPMSDPSRSQRESLDAGPPPPPPPAMPPAGAPAGLGTVPEGRVERSCMSEDLPSITAGFSSGCITTSPFGATASLAPHASGGFFDCTHPGLPPLSPFGDAGVGSQASNSSHARRRSVGKHPANLEHGSTAPPGAIDDLLAVAHSLAQQQAAVQQGQQGTAAPPHTASSSSSGASSSSAGTAAAARFAVPCRQGAAPASSGVAGEPLLSSQVALLAQQLLLHQHQAAASGGGSPAQLRRSLQLQHDAGLAAQQRPLGRSRTVAADELRPAHGAPSAAQLLLSSSGSGAAGGFAALNGGPGPLAARPPLAARYSAPTSPPSEEGSPFSSLQGVYGCHLLPPTDTARVVSPEPSPSMASRSSIDLLLDPMLPAAARTHRQSLDTLSELLLSPTMAVNASTPATTVAQLLQQMPEAGAGACTLAGSMSGGSEAVRPRPRVTVRHSIDGHGAGHGAGRQLALMARSLTQLQGSRRSRQVVDPAASYYGRLLSSGSMHDLANSTVTVVAGAVPAAQQAAAVAHARATSAAHASSIVDPNAATAAGSFESCMGTPGSSILDPDLHDTFGAHPSYGMPSRAAHRKSSSGDPASAAAALNRAIAMLGGAAEAASRGNARRSADGLPPPAAPAAELLRRATELDGVAVADPAAPAAAAAAAAAAGHHPTVYPAHQLLLSAATSVELSPIGNAVMLDPTTIPGQHSITVHDPQTAVPSLQFLKQRALARQKLERMDSTACSRGGYIAEAKRVLAAAVHTASAQEAAVVESSCSGAIGPLLRYLSDNKHHDGALRSGLHTLSLLVSNSPNRGIIVSFHGQAMLCEAMRATRDLEIREDIVQLLWDLEAGRDTKCHFEPDDIMALQAVLEGTRNALVASHILHLMLQCLSGPEPPPMGAPQMHACAQRLVDEIAAHKHHLQDAAQYTLGSLMAVVLGDERVSPPQREQMVLRLLEELARTSTPGQCQVVLTVLSCIAGNARLRSAMAHCRARRRLVDFGQRVADPRLRARSLSLVKILHKQETLESTGGWYFGGGDAAASDTCASPPAG